MGNEQSTQKGVTQNGKVPEKHENGSANGVTANITSTGIDINVNTETKFNQRNEAFNLDLATESTEPDFVVVDSEPAEAQVVPEIIEAVVKVVEAKRSKSAFGKMFKKKPEPPAEVVKVEQPEKSNEDVTDQSPAAADPEPETATADLTPEAQSPPEPDCGVSADAGPEEDNPPETDASQAEESDPDDNPVMNFFKTLVTPTKTSKKETATPDAAKDQTAQVSEPPAAPKGMSIPPPPPPEPPKMEIRGEAAAKPAKPTPKDEPKAAAKQPEPSKGKAAKSAFGKFFRPKTVPDTPPAAVHVELQPGVEEQETPEEAAEAGVEVQSENKVEDQEKAEEVEQPVVEEQVVDGEPESVEEAEKVDPSKAGTLEAAAKPEPPPPVQEEKKKTGSKSPFLSFFKPKAEPKKDPPAPAAAAAEAAQTVKAKEEPKAAAKSAEVVVENKQASVPAADDAANAPKKLEKRNSIGHFFKGFGVKRHSTDAGVQAEPAVAAAAEKTK
ncbi:breast carcinoma-amplified sequence 1 isoform X2 [Pleuronectes platessa]|uniref:breast carcinoma-amplified sequence 1 isoform X2 n=1 Tax=Pleuronectes platessa TaxID=8262 RepID=UPI00232A695E|nr:breast carcinoma-amplified sequence 1 isoform X2 [Pleuronectes platessa]